MNYYTISEALEYLAKNYGQKKMPTSPETLRRAIRTGNLRAQEGTVPGRKGYTISETDLSAYAEKRLGRMQQRVEDPAFRIAGKEIRDETSDLTVDNDSSDDTLLQLHELYSICIEKQLSERERYLAVLQEKAKWEMNLRKKKERRIRLNSLLQSLENDIQYSENAIAVYEKEIEKAGSQDIFGI